MKKIIRFLSYLRVAFGFYVLHKYRNWDYEQIQYFEMSFKPRCKRDENFSKTILDFNKNQLKNKQLE